MLDLSNTFEITVNLYVGSSLTAFPAPGSLTSYLSF